MRFNTKFFEKFSSFGDVRAWRNNCLAVIVTLAPLLLLWAFGWQLGILDFTDKRGFDFEQATGAGGNTELLAHKIAGLLIGITYGLVLFVMPAGYILTFVQARVFRAIGILILFLCCALVLFPLGLLLATLSIWIVSRLGFEIANQPMGLSHLAILPLVTIILGCIAWRVLAPRPESTEALLDPDSVTVFGIRIGTLNGAFWTILVLSLAIICLQSFYHPVVVTTHVYRALLLPFVLGLFVPVVTIISFCSFRLRVPIVLISIVIVASLVATPATVRIVSQETERPTLEESVRRWESVNDCDASSTDPERKCPSPIIISAAGGASRSAFLVGTVVGKLLDQKASKSGKPLRPFERQMFAISGVSGGALGAVVIYAALADSLAKHGASSGLGPPPCVKGAHDTEWFKPHVKQPYRPYASWRDCLQLILAGDFLSPVIIGLVGDTLGVSPHGDRGVILENAWEMRYAHLTRQYATSSETPALESPITKVRHRSLALDDKAWLPVLALGGTSVSTGRRVITSDVDTLLAMKINNLRGRLFRDAYDLHELLAVPAWIRGAVFSPNGQHLLIWFDGAPNARILDARMGTTLEQLDQGGEVEGAIWSPDSQHVLTWSYHGSSRLWHVTDRGAELTSTFEAGYRPGNPAFSKNGDRLLMIDEGRNLASLWEMGAVRVATPKVIEIPEDTHVGGLSPDGRRIVVARNGGGATIYDAEMGKVALNIKDSSHPWGNIHFDGDGKRIGAVMLAKGSESGEAAKIFDVETGKKLFETRQPNRIVAISPDADRLLLAHYGGGMRIRDIASDSELEIPSSEIGVWSNATAVFSPDGRRIVAGEHGEGGLLVIDAATGDQRFVRGQEGLVLGANFHPDGNRIITWSDNGLARVWDLDTGQELYIVRGTQSGADCAGCDIRLSTAATMSARFPIISPHGNVRSRNGLVQDRVVDGGYYENFGAITATEFADELRSQFGLDPRVILINNEPSATGMSCLTRNSQISPPPGHEEKTFSAILTPIAAMWATRNARGTHAAVELCSRIGGGQRFAFVTVKQPKYGGVSELSMSWWLSKQVQQYLDAQVNTDLTKHNVEAFRKIEQWRH